MKPTRTLLAISLLTLSLLATTAAAQTAVTAKPASDAELISRAIAAAAEQAAPAVVSIHVTRTLRRDDTETSAPSGSREAGNSPYFKPRDVDGSGLIWSRRGEVVTSYWNVGQAVDAIAVTLADGTVHPARLEGFDEIYDLALLRIIGFEGDLTTLEHAHGDPRPGQFAIAVGRSLATGGHTASTGVVSALDRRPGEDFLGAIQHSARVNYANNGGPLIDIQGRLLALTVGLNSNPSLNPAGLNSGVSFAVPMDVLEKEIELLRTGIQRKRPAPLGAPNASTPFVGVQLEDDVHGHGVRITRVVPGSGAEAGGLLAGDLVLEFGGARVLELRKLQRVIRRHKVDEEVPVLIEREGVEMTITIKLGKRS